MDKATSTDTFIPLLSWSIQDIGAIKLDIVETLYELAEKFHKSNDRNESFEKVFLKFEPLLNKYARLLHDTDAKYILAEALYRALLKIPLSKKQFKEEKYIVNYIRTAVYHEYLYIIQQNQEENHLDLDLLLNVAASDNDDLFSNIWLKDLSKKLKLILTVKEYNILISRYKGYTIQQIADYYDVTRQSIYKTIKVIVEKVEKSKVLK